MVDNSSNIPWSVQMSGAPAIQAYQTRSALQQLSSDPTYQNASASDQAFLRAQVTGSEDDLKNASALSQASRLDLSNPQQAVQQGVKSGVFTPEQGLTAITSPNMLLMNQGGTPQAPQSALSQINQQQQPGQPPMQGQPPVAQQNQASPTKPSGVDESRLSQYPGFIQSMARAFIYGGEKLPVGTEVKDPMIKVAMKAAFDADPSLAATGGTSRVATQQSAASGNIYQNETALNTMAGHLYDMHEAAPLALSKPNTSPGLNYLSNKVSGAAGLPGTQERSLYNSYADKYSEESAKYFGGGVGSDSGRAEARQPFGDSNPSDTIQKNAKGQVGLIMVKANALQQEYDQGMGNAATKKIVHPDTQALFNDMQGLPLSPVQQQIVNAHRQESQLPLKQWDKSGNPIGLIPSQANQQNSTPQPSTSGQPTLQDLLAERARRSRTK